jgi:membrane protein YqaA with SNARE-associated domain
LTEASETRGGWLRHVSAWAHHPSSPWLLFAVAFADSSFLPIPPDLLLVPMVLMQPRRIWWLLILCTLGSTLGAAVGYLIGYFLWTAIGAPIVEFYGHTHHYLEFQRWVQEWGPLVIIAKALTPIPFKIAAIAAGAAEMNPVVFMLASFAGRALHFAMVALLLFFFGARVMALVARYERPLAVASALALVGLVVVWALR